MNGRIIERQNNYFFLTELLAESVLLPLAFAALLTGVLLGVGTSWGLTRYYWVLTKLVLTISAVTALVFVLRPRCFRYRSPSWLYSFRVKFAVIARRFLPKQSLSFRRIASLRNARNDNYKITLNEYRTGIGKVGVAVTVGPAVALLMLLTTASLAIYKPWGQTQ